jgi:hypothetical protein
MSDKLANVLYQADLHYNGSQGNEYENLARVAREFIAKEHEYIECPWCAGYRVGKADNE